MDPNANLEEMRELSEELLEQCDHVEQIDPQDVNRLAELVIALDGWISAGGFLPRVWDQKSPRRNIS